MKDARMDAAIKKLRENGYRIEVFGPSPEGRFMIGVNGELRTYGEVYGLLADLETRQIGPPKSVN
jgi:hypothetical protein